MITDAIKKKIQTIVSVFETSSLEPRYDILVCLKDGPEVSGQRVVQITYGKHQTTEYSNLKALVKKYCSMDGAKYAADLRLYTTFIGDLKHPLADNESFKALLKKAGTDPLMHQAQDDFFEQFYYNPAYNFFTANRFTFPLSMAVIYDSFIHSGGVPMWLRKRFDEKTPLNGGSEKEWISQYVYVRDNWLEHHENKILRNTDYRTDCWIEQIHTNNWDLSQPVMCKFNQDNQKRWVKIP